MSAIAGVYLLDGSSVDQSDLKRMNNRLSHRGPDGSGLWSEGSVGLAHQMLWTTPESLYEKLPLEVDDLVITSDSRIDNRDELLPILGLSEEISDSEVILRAYGKWGRDCVDRLLGDFAFVIWDKAMGELYCARDHMGVKPFYYYYQPGEIFAFATEIKALFAWGVPQRINEVGIGDYLADILDDKEITFYESVLRLSPAHIMIVNPDMLSREEYWALDPKREIRLGSDEEYEKAFQEIFREAVRCRLRSAFPIGSLLSGGLDSSSVTCMARELLPKECHLKTISAIFDEVKECDEQPYISAVLENGDFEAHYVYADKAGPLSDIERMLWYADQPILAPNLFFRWTLCREAGSQGVRVLLDGIDGDSVVYYGKSYITELVGKGRLFSALNEIRGLSKNPSHSLWRHTLTCAILPFIPDSSMRRSLSYLWHMLHRVEDEPTADLVAANLDFAERIGLEERREKLQKVRSKPPRTAREAHWRLLIWGVQQVRQEASDIASAAFLMECRHPFLDRRLIEFCLALPGDQKIRGGWMRSILRRSLRDILPEKICYRIGKANLSHNFLHGLLTFHRSLMEDTLLGEQNVSSNYIDISYLQDCCRRLISSGELSADRLVIIWKSIILILWLRSIAYSGKGISSRKLKPLRR